MEPTDDELTLPVLPSEPEQACDCDCPCPCGCC